MHGFIRLAAAIPELKVAGVRHNVDQIIQLARRCDADGVAVVVFPELSITGATSGDLFHQTTLLDGVVAGIERICDALRECRVVAVVGAPLRWRQRLYNCGVVIQAGQIRGVVPKSFLPNYREFYEKRWFSSGFGICGETIQWPDSNAPFGTDLLFRDANDRVIGIEICEDLWNVIPPSCHQAIAGANILVNLSASNELVAKSAYRRDLVRNQSARCVAAYVYASSGVTESTADLVYGGHAIIAENGIIVDETQRFQRGQALLVADVDCARLAALRLSETSYRDNAPGEFRIISLAEFNRQQEVTRHVSATPFIPTDPAVRDENCTEIFAIQSSGLAARLHHTGDARPVIGVSGGIDSTLALLVAVDACRRNGRSARDTLAISMPGFGTSTRTFQNARCLCTALEVDFREIDIEAACSLHLESISYSGDRQDRTFENVQARERTQILMNLANQEKGIVVGTSDMSELALGWCTFNGDHISMYAVNCGLPKTLVQHVIQWIADHSDDDLKVILLDIINTPITPELLPRDQEGTVTQRTEDMIGPYELHDFFLYHMLKYGASPSKIRFLASLAFKDRYADDTITKWLTVFVRRFFASQFKRNCVPDGPKVGTIALSPRSDWRMPSDAVAAAWLRELE